MELVPDSGLASTLPRFLRQSERVTRLRGALPMRTQLLFRIVLLTEFVILAFLVAVPASPFPSNGAGEALFARLTLWIPALVLGALACQRSRPTSSTGPSSDRQSHSQRLPSLGLLGASALLWDTTCTGLWVWSLARWPTSPLLVFASLAALAVHLAVTSSQKVAPPST